jgi:2-iminoacetate synthase ThiH
MAMLMHANHLEASYGAGPHTISVPRMRPAAGSETAENPPYPVDDENMKKLVAILRIAVPYTGMILSTREVWHSARALAWVLRHCLIVAVI